MTTTKNNPLLKAADYIEEHGWCRNDWYRADGKACLAGAIGVVTGALVPTKPEVREKALRKYVAEINATAARNAEAGWANQRLYTENDIQRALAGKGPLGETNLWGWSGSRRAVERYGRACDALANQIDSEQFAARLNEHDRTIEQQRSSLWYQALDEAERSDCEGRWADQRTNLGQEPIVTFNDTDEQGKRTTKAKAIKLLRTAAERY